MQEAVQVLLLVAVLVVVALCCCVPVANGAATETKESAKVMGKLERLCYDKCQHHLAPEPGDKACDHFCGFIAHIRVAHEADLYALYREGNRNLQPLMWAMNDVVREKLQAKLDDEDDHTIGEVFFDKAKEWYSRVHQRDEL